MNENENINIILDESELDIKTDPFTNSEHKNVRKQIKENKATAPDVISPEILKRCEISQFLFDWHV